MHRLVTVSVFALLAACGTAPVPETTENAVDPAITAALADPIMADPQLDRRANRDVLRPDDEPYRAMIPPGSPQVARKTGAATLAARTEPDMRGANGAFARCDRNVRYSYGWAADLPSAVPLPPEAAVAEGAGSDATDCRLRLIAYSAALTPEALIGRYRNVARAAGFELRETAKGGAITITALRRDGAAFVARIEPDDSGSVVDLAVNRGR